MDTKAQGLESGSHQSYRSARWLPLLGVAWAIALAVQTAPPAFAGPREQAQRIYERIPGSPPSATVLDQMAAKTAAADLAGAAAIATDASTFYSVTLKNFVTPWTNRDQTVFAPLNDYTATVIGMVRDDVAFNTVLSADILYTINASGLPAVSATNNNHYATAEQNGVDLKAPWLAPSQSAAYGLPTAATAGVMTTRGGSSAF